MLASSDIVGSGFSTLLRPKQTIKNIKNGISFIMKYLNFSIISSKSLDHSNTYEFKMMFIIPSPASISH
jgi:hypothetical protein